jgi:hypothetical protein
MARYPFEADCIREGCGHSSTVHSFDDVQNQGKGVSDPSAQFRCQECGREGCPDMVRSDQNLIDLEKEAKS